MHKDIPSSRDDGCKDRLAGDGRRAAWCLLAVLAVAALWPRHGQAFTITDVSGNVGYTYRALKGAANGDTTSNQGMGALNIKSYLWQPWAATVDAGLRYTYDQTDFQGGGENTGSILTGDLNLGILSQSRTPFSLTYRLSDSRVDIVGLDSPLTTLGSSEFTTSRLLLKQAYITRNGHRFQARFDMNTWDRGQDEQGAEKYDDRLFGLEMDMKMPRQTLIGKASIQQARRSTINQETETKIVNLDHYYYPNRALRIDTMFNIYDSAYQSDQPLNSTNQPDTTTNLVQLSSFAFWRPPDRPLTISGGVRLYGLEGDTTGNSIKTNNYSATGGLFYQYTRNLRLDASFNVVGSDNGEDQNVASNQRAGALYQSDLRKLISGIVYQWYSQGTVQNRTTRLVDNRNMLLKLGHNLQRNWVLGERAASNIRFSFDQSISADEQFGSLDTSTQRLDHSGSISWDQAGASGTSLLQVTLSDVRNFGDLDNNQQFANFQAQRSQTLSRRSSLTGNLTVQYIRMDFNGNGDDDRVTSTGQINYTHSSIFGVPRLRFLSDLRIAKTDVANNVDRTEWENRLNYSIGLLDTRLSWRYFKLRGNGSGSEDQDFHLIYFQVMRRF